MVVLCYHGNKIALIFFCRELSLFFWCWFQCRSWFDLVRHSTFDCFVIFDKVDVAIQRRSKIKQLGILSTLQGKDMWTLTLSYLCHCTKNWWHGRQYTYQCNSPDWQIVYTEFVRSQTETDLVSRYWVYSCHVLTPLEVAIVVFVNAW
jgi:hypothetical protein